MINDNTIRIIRGKGDIRIEYNGIFDEFVRKLRENQGCYYGFDPESILKMITFPPVVGS